MRIREALKVLSGARVSHPSVPTMKLQKALGVILNAARRQADQQDLMLAELNEDAEVISNEEVAVK